MLFKKKIDRTMEWLKEKNNHGKSQVNDKDSNAQWEIEEDNNIELGRDEIFAIVISAMLVFGPIILILFLILIFLL